MSIRSSFTRAVLLLVTIFAIACPAGAQELMPAPRRMPRIPVARETLSGRQTEQVTRVVTGQAAVIDTERLRIGNVDIRLFGIVTPQASATFGPQARTALDQLTAAQSVTCEVRDRDRDGRLLATCTNAAGNDLAAEMLKRGLALTARGTIADTDLAPVYMAAEQAAQGDRLGLWSNAPAPPALTHAETAAASAAIEDKAAPRTEKSFLSIVPAAAVAAPAITTLPAAQDFAEQSPAIAARPAEPGTPGFIERYQALAAALVMMITAFGITGAVLARQTRDRRDETRGVAAALRGELMAARGVCLGRLKMIGSDEDDLAMTWPRIRTTLYQAYVGRLGMLGAELARQVASVYGQSHDYAVLYSPQGAAYDQPKRLALETLTRHIEEILPKLAAIEQTGTTPVYYNPAPMRLTYDGTPGGTLGGLPRPPGSSGQPQGQPMPGHSSAPRAVHAPGPASPVRQVEGRATAISARPSPPRPNAAPALWDTVRDFVQTHRNAMLQGSPHADNTQDADADAVDYAAMIEADMERYPYTERPDPFDLGAHKRRG